MTPEERNIQRPLDEARAYLHRLWSEKLRDLHSDMVKDVDLLIDLLDIEFKEMQKAHTNHVDHGDIQEVKSAFEGLGDNPVSIWHFNSDTEQWSFYDGDEGSTLTHVITGESYLLHTESVTTVILNGKTRVLANGWNQIVW